MIALQMGSEANPSHKLNYQHSDVTVEFIKVIFEVWEMVIRENNEATKKDELVAWERQSELMLINGISKLKNIWTCFVNNIELHWYHTKPHILRHLHHVSEGQS